MLRAKPRKTLRRCGERASARQCANGSLVFVQFGSVLFVLLKKFSHSYQFFDVHLNKIRGSHILVHAGVSQKIRIFWTGDDLAETLECELLFKNLLVFLLQGFENLPRVD